MQFALLGMKTLPKSQNLLRHWRWLVALALIVTGGCSGINASKSVSPLDFILPGLHGRTDPAAPRPNGTNTVVFVSWVGHQG
jgi:hypothetical protein